MNECIIPRVDFSPDKMFLVNIKYAQDKESRKKSIEPTMRKLCSGQEIRRHKHVYRDVESCIKLN